MSKAQNLGSIVVIQQEFLSMYNSSQDKDAFSCPNGSTIWRASKGSCWFTDSYNCYNWTMRPCPNSACCLHAFSVCMDNGAFKMTLTNTIVPSVPCDAPQNPGSCAVVAANGQCYFTCDNDGIEDVLGAQTHSEGEPEISQIREVILAPQPTTHSTTTRAENR